MAPRFSLAAYTEAINRVEDLTGRRFERLTVRFLDLTNEEYGARWICDCDCGGQSAVRSRELMNGTTRSCGCARINQFAKTHLGRNSRIPAGTRYGDLTVGEHVEVRGQHRFYACTCECGHTSMVRANLLPIRQTQSCGHRAGRPGGGLPVPNQAAA